MRRVAPRVSIASFFGKTSAFLLAATIVAAAPTGQAAHATTTKQAVTPQKKPTAAAPARKPVLVARALPTAKPPAAKQAASKASSKVAAARPAVKPTPARTAKPVKGKPGAAKAVPAHGFLSLPAAKSKPAFRTASVSATAAPTQDRRIIALLEEDETLIDVLVRENVTPDDLVAAIDAFEDIEERARLARGDRIELVIDGANPAGEHNLTALRIVRSKGGDVTLVRSADGTFTAAQAADTRAATMVTMTGTVSGDWKASLTAADVPPDLAEEVDRLLALDLDLPHPVPRGASFEILAERRDSEGRGRSHIVRSIGVNVAGYDHRVYRYMPQDGAAGYFDERGRSIAPLTLTMPIEDGRLTSEFGWRKHPKLKRRMFHRGIDLAAPIGTPIVASADGTVEWAGWRGAYGRYVRINHGSGLSSGYGHLSDYAPGIAEGTTVHQGQVIGFVGSSGRSTGPHVDFSVLVDGQPVNPMHALMPAPRDLRGPELLAFNAHIQQMRGVAQATP